MEYRVYIEEKFGYEHFGTYNIEELIVVLDIMCITKRIKQKILVIEHDKELNSDFPVLLYTGHIDDYMTDREYLEQARLVKVKQV